MPPPPDHDRQKHPARAGASSRKADRKSEAGGEGSDAMRIAKAMARAGLCSRRDAERWIAEGRVAVNGSILTTPAVTVGPDDRVEVDGQPMRKPEAARLWRYHKPRGRVTTHRDPEGRPTVFEALPEDMPRVISIGRLDFNTEGLLLLTTNGALARHLELPATGWLRRYRVRAHGNVTPEALKALADGVEVDGVHYGPVEATLDRQQGANVWITVGLREGKNREVRKILGTLNLEVTRLIRVSFGPFALGDLAPGAVEEVQPRVIAEQVGGAMAGELGLRFASAAAGRPRRAEDGPERKPTRPREIKTESGELQGLVRRPYHGRGRKPSFAGKPGRPPDKAPGKPPGKPRPRS